MKNFYFISIVLLFLQACGGSSGSSSSNLVPPNKPTEKGLSIQGDLSPAQGQSVALIATYDGEMSEQATINWRQLAGPTLELVATDSAVLAFDIVGAGDYQFSVSFTGQDNKQHQKTVSFTTANSNNILNVRRDHAVRSGNKVSLKLSAPKDSQSGAYLEQDFSNVVWRQTAGPTATLDSANTNELVAIFKAPSVTKDQLISFAVSATHPNGKTYTDEVHVLVQHIKPIPNNAYFDETIGKVKAYQTSSPYAEALERCVYTNHLTHACLFSELNLIGQDHGEPSIDDIMSRVLVSHQWMGDNFKLFLENEDVHGDFKQLLRSVSAVVISYDIRPSFYTTATGAIYLDPENLWLTPTQRDVIDVAPDYRSAFGQELQYIMPWRYVKDNSYADDYYPRTLRDSRTTADIVPELASLLYHELAHANDYFASTTYNDITQSSIYTEARARDGKTVAAQLTDSYPKQSAEMDALGGVNFRGETATETQKGYLPDDIVEFFSNDSAATEYAYSSVREDVATLFDATMMSLRYGIERDEAITPPYDSSVGRASLTLNWGQRGRAKDPLVEPRVKFVLERIMPSLDAQQALDSLPPVRYLPVGATWDEAISLNSDADKSAPKFAQRAVSSRKQRPIMLDIKQKHK